MLDKSLNWFFVLFNNEFRQDKVDAFQITMFLALAHCFGCYNPKQLSDYLGIHHQSLYTHLKGWSLYRVKKMLTAFMAHQAAERIRPVLEKSAATKSRAGITMSVDNSVIDRYGKMLRCTWSQYSGRFKKVVNGQDLPGIIMTIDGVAIPIGLLFCSWQGRADTDKPDLLIAMLTELVKAFKDEGVDLTRFPISMDSWYASDPLKKRLYKSGFKDIIVAGKSNYVFTIDGEKKNASEWKKELELEDDLWGIDVPATRKKAFSPTFDKIIVFFFQKSSTRCYYLMDLSEKPKRGAEIWRIWKQHHLIEAFWKTLKSVFKFKEMRLQGEGLYTGLLIKVLAYLLTIRLQKKKEFLKLSLLQIMRKVNREKDLKTLMIEHFHLPNALIAEIMKA